MEIAGEFCFFFVYKLERTGFQFLLHSMMGQKCDADAVRYRAFYSLGAA